MIEEMRQIRLNEYQRAAVLDDSPACVVNANVGSGKTTVLIEKILYLHQEKQVPLEQMVVLTFTNKAADEITERLMRQEPQITADQIQGFGTFHSVALRLLKNRLPVEQAGWTKGFTVMDPDEETDLALEIIAEQGLKVKYRNRLKKRLEQEYQAYLAGKADSRYKDDLFRLYPLLLEEKKKQNKMSFADLLRVSMKLLTDGEWHPKWVIVDEVQDSDRLQLEFLEALCGPQKSAKLFAVGDPNQVIYSWRGTGENMFFFLKHRFGAKELTLPVNYRSNASILEAANRFLQFGDQICGNREETGKIVVKNHYDPFQEAEYLAERIRTLHEKGEPYSGIAVFYRLQKQSEILVKVFERQGIPCELSVKKTLKDIPVLDWLVKVFRFSVNPTDTHTAMQVLTDTRYGEKCTKKQAQDIVRRAIGEKGETPERIAEVTAVSGKAGGSDRFFRKMQGFQDHFSGRGTGKVGIPSAEELFAYFGLKEILHPTSAEYASDAEKVMGFLKKMCAVCSVGTGERDFTDCVREFINSSALYGMKLDAGEKAADEEKGAEEADTDTVKLMTLHASKGLEFDTVFLTGMNQGLIPLRCRNFEHEEEERRLFFVGITRARNELELSWYTNPGEPGILGEPSRYLQMIPQHLLKRDDVRTEEEKRNNLQQMRREVQEQIRKKRTEAEAKPEKKDQEKKETGDEVPGKGKAGSGAKPSEQRVRHRKYGEGILVSEDEMMVEVEFPGYGRKQFLKAFGEVEML